MVGWNNLYRHSWIWHRDNQIDPDRMSKLSKRYYLNQLGKPHSNSSIPYEDCNDGGVKDVIDQKFDIQNDCQKEGFL